MPRQPVTNLLTLFASIIFLAGICTDAPGQDIESAANLLLTGDYERAYEQSASAIQDGVYGEAWHVLRAKSLLAIGEYTQAYDSISESLKKYNWSIRLYATGIEAARFAGQRGDAEQFANEIARLVRAAPWRYTDAENLVVLGHYALDQGLDAKSVKETFFSRAQRNNPTHRAPAIALGRLAIDKRDYQLAADILTKALEVHADDADILFYAGLAFASSDRDRADELIGQALEVNPRHVEALLWRVDRLLDGEQYSAATEILDAIHKFHAKEHRALAFQAAIELIAGNVDASDELRDQALSTWNTNPEVDHIIGREMSQKYRFSEGAQYQKLALAMDEEYLPAKKQLAEDLLRLGRESEGWRVAEEAYSADEYDIAMYNLITLRDELDKFVTVENEFFKIRMDALEAEVYGPQVLELLSLARATLCSKYRLELSEPTLVEIFPRPNDFAVRTFGMPGADGFLGVCFGNVITANSPASQMANPTSWESVLWHEFAHVVTLNKTFNRMPRWLSEGISVYEERQRDASWGEQMTPQYREMILSDETLTPVSELSSAFLAPLSGLHLQFAYFESSLVVEYIIQEYGFEALLTILQDLALGISINEALDRRTDSLPELEQGFVAFARAQALAYGPNVDWSEPDLGETLQSPLAGVSLAAWLTENPTNYYGLKLCAQYYIQNEAWESAQEVLEKMVELFPDERSGTAPTLLLAEVARRQGNSQRERELLKEYVQRDPDAVDAFRRLIEIELEQENWTAVRKTALRQVGVNPLTHDVHAALARSSEELGDAQGAIKALSALVALEHDDLAGIHFRKAQQLKTVDRQSEAKREVLLALEEAPRYRDALRMLLQIRSEDDRQRSEDQLDEDGLPPAVDLPKTVGASGAN